MAEYLPDNQVAANTTTPASGVTSVAVDSVTKKLRTKDDAAAVVDYIGLTDTEQGASRVQNKDLDAATTKIVDGTDTTKKIGFQASGATTGTTLTLIEAQTTSQSLNVPNIAGSSILITDTLAQNITGVKTMTNPTAAAGTTSVPSMTLTTAGTLMTTPTAGVVEVDSAAYYNTMDTTEGRRVSDSWRFFKLAANGTPFTAITDFFGTNSAAGFVTNAVLEIEWHCYFAIATLSTQVVTWTITNTQTTTNMVANWAAQNAIANGATQGVLTGATLVTQTGAAVALPNTGVMVIGNHYHIVRALIETATAGNVRLRCNTASTATVGPLRGSWFRVRRLPALNAGTFVA